MFCPILGHVSERVSPSLLTLIQSKHDLVCAILYVNQSEL